jgi:hypothetical protein
MGEPEVVVLYASGRDPGERRAVWWFLPWVVAATAGVWAIDRYAGRWLGAWRVIPEVALGGYALLSGLVGVLLLATEASVRLTEEYLEVRRPWRRQRWAWTELRDIRVLNLGQTPTSATGRHDTAGILALIPQSGPAVPLPSPFQGSSAEQMDQLAERLITALHRHNPRAESLDDAALDAAQQDLRERLQTRERRRARRGKHWPLAFALFVGTGLVVFAIAIVRALVDGQPWRQATFGALFGVFGLVQVALAKGYLKRFPGPLQRAAGVVPWLTLAALLFLIQRGS